MGISIKILHCNNSIWRTAYVRPIFKGGDATSINNYRPISLTCTCCKLMESIINDQLVDYLFTNDLITKHQHGFIKRRSTCTQLLESFQDWTLALNDKKCLDVLYLDFSRAFDTLVHSKLLHKLRSYGVQHELLNWIESFLSGRSQRVLIDGHLSFSANVTSGIGQGSILGPSFFVLFINDITDCFDALSTCKLYADDVKLYTSFNHHLGPDSLLSSLAKVQQWAIDWQLKLNPLKCSVLHLGPRNPKNTYVIDDKILNSPDVVRDLGIVYDSKLSFNVYIDYIVSKAYQRVNLIFRSFYSRDPKILKLAYNTYVKPILEYCTSVWSPFLIKDIDRIEGVQRYFTRRVFYKNEFSYNDRLFLLDMEALNVRRVETDLTMYYKVINGLNDLNPSDLFCIFSQFEFINKRTLS